MVKETIIKRLQTKFDEVSKEKWKDEEGTIVVHNICEYIEVLSVFTELNRVAMPEISAFPICFYWRGQRNCEWQILPALGRDRTSRGSLTIFDEEANLVAEAKRHFPQLFPEDLLPVEVLARVQHYGFPTRLLDLTTNPLVALYFACQEERDKNGNAKDGEVLVFVHHFAQFSNTGVVQLIADTVNWPIWTEKTLETIRRYALDQPYMCRQKLCLRNKQIGRTRLKEFCICGPHYVYSQNAFQRQYAQSGLYILFPNEIAPRFRDGEECFVSNIQAVPKSAVPTGIFMRLLIPATIKQELLRLLATMEISKARLFPENVDLVADELKREAEKRVGFACCSELRGV